MPAIQVKSSDIAEILYTGGTTGLPKGVPLSNILLLEAIQVSRDMSESVVPKGKQLRSRGAP